MDLNQFRKQFPSEEACRQYLETVVWPQGRRCPHCWGQKSWLLSGASARLQQRLNGHRYMVKIGMHSPMAQFLGHVGGELKRIATKCLMSHVGLNLC